MQAYIAKQPIHDERHEVAAYEIMYVEDHKPVEKGDAAAANTLESLLLQYNSDGFLEGKTAFVTFTPNLLFRNVPHIFDTKKLVVQFDEEALLYPLALKMVEKFRKQGYRTAMKGFEFKTRYLSALDLVDFVKINFARPAIDGMVETIARMGKQIIAYNVDTKEQYEYAQSLKVKYMQGAYIGTILPQRIHKLKHLQSNFFQLMVAVTREEPDIDEIEEIIARDVTLTYALVKLVNSAYFALRHKVVSVHQALVILGLGQLKQWIYLLSFQQDDALPSEFIKISFMRATLCSELVPLVEDIDISKTEGYLMGMFSTLESLLETTLEESLRELSLSDAVSEALLEHKGRAGLLFDLVLGYESGEWITVSNACEDLGIPVSVVSQKYFEAMESVNEIWNQLTSTYEAPIETDPLMK